MLFRIIKNWLFVSIAFITPALLFAQQTDANGRLPGQVPSPVTEQIEKPTDLQIPETAENQKFMAAGSEGMMSDQDVPGLQKKPALDKGSIWDNPNEIQRVKEDLDLLHAEVSQLRVLNEQLLLENARMRRSFSECCQAAGDYKSLPVLFQNVPNPGREKISIGYFLPQNATRSTLRVYTPSGVLLIEQSNLRTGNGAVELDCKNLEPGFYVYSLYSGDQVLDSKIMLIQ